MITGGGGGSSTPAFAFGTAAARPAAAVGNTNTGYYATDTGEVTISDGASWHSLGYTSGGFRAVGNLITQGTLFVTTNGLDIQSAGQGISVAEGANAKQGTATLVAGSKVVSNTAVTANSRIFITSQADGGAPGFLRVSARTAGTSFTVTSSSGTDTSTFAYEIFEPG